MKQLIRKGVFETNSSSSHSIHIDMETDLIDIPIPDENGIIFIRGGQFGWEIREYCDFATKASYCAQDIVHQEGAVNRFNENKKNLMISVIKHFTGCKDVYFDDESLGEGYIDHQSSGTSDDAFESIVTLGNFLFNQNSILKTDNDNH